MRRRRFTRASRWRVMRSPTRPSSSSASRRSSVSGSSTFCLRRVWCVPNTFLESVSRSVPKRSSTSAWRSTSVSSRPMNTRSRLVWFMRSSWCENTRNEYESVWRMVMSTLLFRMNVISEMMGSSVSTRESTVVVMKRPPSSQYSREVASISRISSLVGISMRQSDSAYRNSSASGVSRSIQNTSPRRSSCSSRPTVRAIPFSVCVYMRIIFLGGGVISVLHGTHARRGLILPRFAAKIKPKGSPCAHSHAFSSEPDNGTKNSAGRACRILYIQDSKSNIQNLSHYGIKRQLPCCTRVSKDALAFASPRSSAMRR